MLMLYNDRRFRNRRRNLRNHATEAEQLLWFVLRERGFRGLKFRRQYGVGPYILDFFCPSIRLAIEVDGGQHYDDDRRLYDRKRSAFLARHDIRVVRVSNAEVLNRLDEVVAFLDRIVTTPFTSSRQEA